MIGLSKGVDLLLQGVDREERERRSRFKKDNIETEYSIYFSTTNT